MNSKSFYMEIGNIDDDLILEASEARGNKSKKIIFLRIAGVAACLCLMCIAVFWGLGRDVIHYNEAPTPPTAKVLIPSDENTTVFTLTYRELFDYYEIQPLPDMLSGLERTEQSFYFVYEWAEDAVYDTNIISYRSDDGNQTLSVMLSKNAYDTVEEEFKESRIDGVSLILAESEDAEKVYWAELCIQGVHIRAVSYGMDEAAFTEIIREIIRCQKLK